MTICVLGMLVLMVGAFAAITRIERAASTNYVDGERAKFIAWSGVERAKYELRRAPCTPEFPLKWMTYEPSYAADVLLPPTEQSTEPSFRLFPPMAAGDPRLPEALDSTSGVVLPWPSGVIGATYYRDAKNPAFGGDYYVLKVEDTNAKIALNDGNPHLRKMLNTLAQHVYEAKGLTPPTDLGAKVLSGMPKEGFRSVEDLRRVLDETEFANISPFVAVHSFIDRRVIEMGEQYTAPDTGGTVSTRPRTLARQPRAPVNVNTAPLPVLVAVFNGIARGGDAIDYAKAKELAAAVKAKRDQLMQATGNGIPNWSEFYKFLLNEVPGLTKYQASAVLANCNPNTDTNKLVPDLSMYRPIDKLDLERATTELTFASGGIYEIESVGVVLAPDASAAEGGQHVARIVAMSKVRSTVRVFERMVERMQDDFEGPDRKDPDSPSTHVNLRDLTTLPEYRNNGSGTNTDPADWDGQLTFNVITSQEVSVDGGAAGNIAGSLDGKMMVGGGLGNIGTARGAGGQSVATPDLASGSDLHPFGARTGEGGRSLAFAQDPAIAVVNHEVPRSEIVLLGDGHTVTDILAILPGWMYDSVDAHAFELWFKPDHPLDTGGSITGSTKQVLLEWVSGDPQPNGAPSPIVPGGSLSLGPEFLHDVHAANVDNYLGAVNAGGPGPQGEPTVEVSGAGVPLPPPPLSEFFGEPLGTGPLPWNQTPYPPDRDPAADAELYADIADAWFEQKFRELMGDIFDGSSMSGTEDITWGAKARLQVWLQRTGGDPISPKFTVNASFVVEKKNEEYNSTSNLYSRTWVSDPVRAGTWHHLLFSFYALLPPRDAGNTPPEHTNLYVDAKHVPASAGSDSWPTEIHAQGRIAKRVVDLLNAQMAGTTDVFGQALAIEFDVEDYRVPVVIPRGGTPVQVGDAISHDQAFRGLIDNAIFQGNWPKFFGGPAPTGASPGRFDLWRPSLGRVTQPGDDYHLRYVKRTQQLEWDQPIRVASYGWTAWKHNDVQGGALSLGLV